MANKNKKTVSGRNFKIFMFVIILALAIYIGVKLISRNKTDEQSNAEIQYTDQLNYTAYVDENGDYVIEYDNGDKTIETNSNKQS